MGDVTDEAVVQIATDFILNSPPGELMEVVTDVKGVLTDESILNNILVDIFREYHTEQMVQVHSPNNNHQVLITKHGEVADGEYLDPRGNQVLTYDHIKQEVIGSRPIGGELNSDAEPYRAAFESEALKYVSEHYYPHGAVTVYGKKHRNQFKIIVCISSSKFNPNNNWNGRWRSTWQVIFEPNGGLANLDGKIQVNLHFLEDGSAQLNTNTEKHLEVLTTGDPSTTASSVLKAITTAEQMFHTSLDSSYAALGNTLFKTLRRQPIYKGIWWRGLQFVKIRNEPNTENSSV